jgi:hypothetical protein
MRETALGQEKNRIKWDNYKNEIHNIAADKYKNIRLDKNIYELLCSMLYICEGNTGVESGVRFMNSDPYLIRLFLYLLRNSFTIDERKFRVCLHLHGYHNKNSQIDFWSKTTGISIGQFLKPYQKKSTKKRIREGYQGCVSIRYYDNKVGQELQSIYGHLLDDLKIK